MRKFVVLGLMSLLAVPVAAHGNVDKEKGSTAADGIYVYDGVYDTVNMTFKAKGSQFPIDLIDCSDAQSLCYYSDYSGGIVVPRCGKSVRKGLKHSYLIDELGKTHLRGGGKNTRASVYSFKYTIDNSEVYSILFYTPQKGLIAKANYEGDLNDLLDGPSRKVLTEDLKIHYAKGEKGMFAC